MLRDVMMLKVGLVGVSGVSRDAAQIPGRFTAINNQWIIAQYQTL